MSKIGRKPIVLTSATVEIVDSAITIKGPKDTFSHELPSVLFFEQEGKTLFVRAHDALDSYTKMMWGLHRSLLANKVKGVETGFEQKMKIVGLGLKAQIAGSKMTLSLGYSHKIDYEVPQGVKVDIDKTGQALTLNATDKALLGSVCDQIRSFRKPEPYKGTGIMLEGEVIIRKAGKTKA